MKLTFKDLKQQKFVIEAQGTDLISSVKEKIQAEKGWEVPLQKLIYSGKILQDANTVESYKIEEKGFVVCMVSKPKAAPAVVAPKVPSTPASAITITPSTPAPPAHGSSTASAPAPGTPTPVGSGVPSESPAAQAGSGGLSMGSERAAQIANMESMGFERSQIDAAMRAAFYNSERAVEYLLNGIPDSVQQQQQQPRAPAPAPAGQTPASPSPAAGGNDGGDDEGLNLFEAAAQAGGRGGAAPGGGAAGSGDLRNLLAGAGAGAGAGAEGAAGLGNLDFLRNNPQFQTLRQVVQQQPHMLEPILQQVGAGNPQLAELIGRHPEQFLELLSEDNDNDAPLPPGVQAISVTEEDQAAIGRLTQLGFTRDQVVQAYLACDRDEELAANFLFDMPDEDELQ